MRFFALLMIAGFAVAAPVHAQDAAVEEVPVEQVKPAPVPREQPPVVANTRKAAYDAKKKAEQERAQKEAEAAKKRLEAAKAAPPAPEPVIEYRRYNPAKRDAMTGKEIKQNPAPEKQKKQTENERIRDKFKKRREKMSK